MCVRLCLACVCVCTPVPCWCAGLHACACASVRLQGVGLCVAHAAVVQGWQQAKGQRHEHLENTSLPLCVSMLTQPSYATRLHRDKNALLTVNSWGSGTYSFLLYMEITKLERAGACPPNCVV